MILAIITVTVVALALLAALVCVCAYITKKRTIQARKHADDTEASRSDKEKLLKQSKGVPLKRKNSASDKRPSPLRELCPADFLMGNALNRNKHQKKSQSVAVKDDHNKSVSSELDNEKDDSLGVIQRNNPVLISHRRAAGPPRSRPTRLNRTLQQDPSLGGSMSVLTVPPSPMAMPRIMSDSMTEGCRSDDLADIKVVEVNPILVSDEIAAVNMDTTVDKKYTLSQNTAVEEEDEKEEEASTPSGDSMGLIKGTPSSDNTDGVTEEVEEAEEEEKEEERDTKQEEESSNIFVKMLADIPALNKGVGGGGGGGDGDATKEAAAKEAAKDVRQSIGDVVMRDSRTTEALARASAAEERETAKEEEKEEEEDTDDDIITSKHAVPDRTRERRLSGARALKEMHGDSLYPEAARRRSSTDTTPPISFRSTHRALISDKPFVADKRQPSPDRRTRPSEQSAPWLQEVGAAERPVSSIWKAKSHDHETGLIGKAILPSNKAVIHEQTQFKLKTEDSPTHRETKI